MNRDNWDLFALGAVTIVFVCAVGAVVAGLL